MGERDSDSAGQLQFVGRLGLLILFAVVSALLFGLAAAETPDGPVFDPSLDEPTLQCIGTGGGIQYTTDAGLVVYQNHTADINQFYFPSANTVRFNYSTGAMTFFADEPDGGDAPDVRLERIDNGIYCLGGLNATDTPLIIQPDGGLGLEVSGSEIDLSFRNPVFDPSDDGVDMIYDAESFDSVSILNTGLDKGESVILRNATTGEQLDTSEVDADGVVSFSDLSAGQQSLSVEVESSGDNGDNGDNGDSGSSGGSSGSSSGGSSSSDDDSDDSDTETEREVTEVTADDSEDAEDDSDDSDEESEVRSSSVSASVTGGSTLSISLGLDDIDLDSPDEADDPDETQEPDEADEDDLEDADEEAVDEDEPEDDEADAEEDPEDESGDTDQPQVADSDIGERPPPVSQAEVESVEIDVNQDADADIEIRQSRSPPSEDAREFERADGTQAAGCVQVNNNLDPDAVDGGRIDYRLSKEDLETDDTDPENVAMYYFNTESEEWDELPTEITGETDDHVRFRAETEGFSEFASGIKRAQFEVSDAVVDVQEVTLGDTVRVEAIITNTGGADGTFRTELVVDDDVVEDDILTIAANGTRATLFDHEFIHPDTYEVRVNDVSTGEITVLAPDSSDADDETESFIPGFGLGAAVISLLVASLAVWRRQK